MGRALRRELPSLAWVPDALAEGPVSWRLEPDGGFLFHEAALGFHTEHSERHAMPSWAAAEGAPPDLVDGLGGWRLKGGEVYVDTMTRRIEKAQIAVAAAARLKAPHEDCFDESIIAERLRRSLLERSVGPQASCGSCFAWTSRGSGTLARCRC